MELDAGQTPDAVNYLYFCHNARNLVSVGQRVKSGDALAVMGNTGNAALASPPFAHCHFEVRATTTGAGLDPTEYTGHPNAVGTYGTAINGMEDDGMKFLKVTSGKCEVFTAPDVNAVDKAYNGGRLTEGVCYPVQAEVGSSGGYSWVRIFAAGVQRYAVVLADRCRLVTLSRATRSRPAWRREVRAAAQKNLKRSLKQRTPERMPRSAARMKRTNAPTQLSSARMLRTENCWILRRMLRASNVVSILSFLCILFH